VEVVYKRSEKKMKEPQGTTGDGLICPHCDKMVSFDLVNFDDKFPEGESEYASRHVCICPSCNDLIKLLVKK